MSQMLNSDALIEAACKQTGLNTFDADTYREGLDVFVEDFNDGIAIGRYTEAGIERVRNDCVHYLASRLKVADYLRQHPELLERKIERPVFVMGMARTGTTLMSNLLGADPNRRSPLTWKSTIPCRRQPRQRSRSIPAPSPYWNRNAPGWPPIRNRASSIAVRRSTRTNACSSWRTISRR